MHEVVWWLHACTRKHLGSVKENCTISSCHPIWWSRLLHIQVCLMVYNFFFFLMPRDSIQHIFVMQVISTKHYTPTSLNQLLISNVFSLFFHRWVCVEARELHVYVEQLFRSSPCVCVNLELYNQNNRGNCEKRRRGLARGLFFTNTATTTATSMPSTC